MWWAGGRGCGGRERAQVSQENPVHPTPGSADGALETSGLSQALPQTSSVMLSPPHLLSLSLPLCKLGIMITVVYSSVESVYCKAFRVVPWHIIFKCWLFLLLAHYLSVCYFYYACMLSHFSHIQLIVTPWTIAQGAHVISTGGPRDCPWGPT